jgi:hypothetical protein
MFTKKYFSDLNAAKITASLFGILAGIGGIIHGPGEILQGNIAPTGISFNSWILEPIATNVGGEPAMSLIPNLLITGIITIIISTIVILWSALFITKRNGGAILIGLSVLMLLVGGGFAPPIIGILSGIAGMGINSPTPKWCKNLPNNLNKYVSKLWTYIFAVTAINGIFLIIGAIVLAYIIGLNIPSVWVFCFLFSIPTILITIITGVSYDYIKSRNV